MTSDLEQNSYICLIYNSLQLSISSNVTQVFCTCYPYQKLILILTGFKNILIIPSTSWSSLLRRSWRGSNGHKDTEDLSLSSTRCTRFKAFYNKA